MRITSEWLNEKNACEAGRQWFFNQKETELTSIVKALMKEDRFLWANWTLTRAFTHSQNIQYAVYSAKQVLSICEKRYPKDKRPRKAIAAAVKYLKNPTQENKDAAAYAAYAATDAYADAVTDAYASNAAYAADANAAYAAANAAANATDAYASNAAYAAYAADDNAAYAAAYAAANAADAAYAADAVYAANAAANAADAVYAANAAQRKLQRKIIQYGLSLLKKELVK